MVQVSVSLLVSTGGGGVSSEGLVSEPDESKCGASKPNESGISPPSGPPSPPEVGPQSRLVPQWPPVTPGSVEAVAQPTATRSNAVTATSAAARAR